VIKINRSKLNLWLVGMNVKHTIFKPISTTPKLELKYCSNWKKNTNEN